LSAVVDLNIRRDYIEAAIWNRVFASPVHLFSVYRSILAVSDKELEEIAKNTKLKISEEVQVEGIQQFDHIWHLGKLEENKYLVSGYAQQTSLIGKMIKDDNSYSIFNIKSRSINQYGRKENLNLVFNAVMVDKYTFLHIKNDTAPVNPKIFDGDKIVWESTQYKSRYECSKLCL